MALTLNGLLRINVLQYIAENLNSFQYWEQFKRTLLNPYLASAGCPDIGIQLLKF